MRRLRNGGPDDMNQMNIVDRQAGERKTTIKIPGQAEFEGMRVPDVLVSGDHARIDAWRSEQALDRTRQRRPDLLQHPGRGAASNQRVNARQA
ncbi:MAG: hypothetical protein IIA40_11170 [SAR324 cluster bacterium]|nr:hypothetical protein [SAR324 cluster bacterium]